MNHYKKNPHVGHGFHRFHPDLGWDQRIISGEAQPEARQIFSHSFHGGYGMKDL